MVQGDVEDLQISTKRAQAGRLLAEDGQLCEYEIPKKMTWSKKSDMLMLAIRVDLQGSESDRLLMQRSEASDVICLDFAAVTGNGN